MILKVFLHLYIQRRWLPSGILMEIEGGEAGRHAASHFAFPCGPWNGLIDLISVFERRKNKKKGNKKLP
jgi:hypothetical protein